MSRHKRKVYLVMQNAWDSDLLTMPLALGYLKAYAEADPNLSRAVDIRIFNYSRRATVSQMAVDLFSDPPDVLACSVLGWNYDNFGRLSDTFRQVRPGGWCVFGGNHVSHQAHRVFQRYPSVSLVVNGEGEITFRDVLAAHVADRPLEACVAIPGVSLRHEDGTIVTAPERARLTNLDDVPSPFLTGAIPLFDAAGRFLYDTALMETCRGCPYRCAFCYWGGAVGQKMHGFSRGRLRAELEFFAERRIENLCLCDSNFGMRPADVEFVEDLIAVRQQRGYPRDLVTSWAKNKSKNFYSIVKILKDTGFHTDFTLSLQTLNSEALAHMQRQNMKLNDFEDLCAWLETEGMDAHAELIWGAPGETRATFLAGYDRVAKYVTRVATYPLLLLPNTEYANTKAEHGMVTIRDGSSDYEFVLSHASISLRENQKMHRFLFWARLLAEYQVFRRVFPAVLRVGGITQSQVILDVDEWFVQQTDPALLALARHVDEVVENFDITRIPNAVLHTYLHEAELEPLFERWWCDRILPQCDPLYGAFLQDVFRYDWLSRPHHDEEARRGVGIADIDGEQFWVRSRDDFRYDVPRVLAELCHSDPGIAIGSPHWQEVVLYYRKGFASVVASHEFVARYSGKTETDLRAEQRLLREGLRSAMPQRHAVGLVKHAFADSGRHEARR